MMVRAHPCRCHGMHCTRTMLVSVRVTPSLAVRPGSNTASMHGCIKSVAGHGAQDFPVNSPLFLCPFKFSSLLGSLGRGTLVVRGSFDSCIGGFRVPLLVSSGFHYTTVRRLCMLYACCNYACMCYVRSSHPDFSMDFSTYKQLALTCMKIRTKMRRFARAQVRRCVIAHNPHTHVEIFRPLFF